MAADEEGNEPKQVEYEGDHKPRVWLDSVDRSTTCPGGHRLGEG